MGGEMVDKASGWENGWYCQGGEMVGTVRVGKW